MSMLDDILLRPLTLAEAIDGVDIPATQKQQIKDLILELVDETYSHMADFPNMGDELKERINKL